MKNYGFYNIFDRTGMKVGSIEPDFTYGLLELLMAPFTPILSIAAIAFIFWLSYTMVTFLLGALNSGGVLSYEIWAMVIGTLLSWEIAYLMIVFSKNDEDVLPGMCALGLVVIIVGTYVFSLIGLAYVDIVFNDAFANFFSGLWFVISMLLSLILMLLWTLITSIAGIIIVGLCAVVTKLSIIGIKYQIKLNKKMNRIKNSDCFKEVLASINEFREVNIQTVKVSDKDIVITNNEEKKKVLNYAREGYSSLDEDGRMSMALLIRKEFRTLKVQSKTDVLVMANKEYIKKCKEDARKAKAEEKVRVKEEKIKRKKRIKEEKNSTKDW